MKNFHPILFTSEMIRANLEGRKTQTRRVVKFPYPSTWDRAKVPARWDPSDFVWVDHADPCGTYPTLTVCPYGVPGDVLWAREKWQYADWSEDGQPWIRYQADGAALLRLPDEDSCDRVEDIWAELSAQNRDGPACDKRWRPSIHMPKWACRLWCRVESVRVQRVQEITLADCAAEGAPPTHDADQVWDSTDTYRKLWNRINEGRGFGWKANPWVWAITYTVLKEAPPGWSEYLGQLPVIEAGMKP